MPNNCYASKACITPRVFYQVYRKRPKKVKDNIRERKKATTRLSRGSEHLHIETRTCTACNQRYSEIIVGVFKRRRYMYFASLASLSLEASLRNWCQQLGWNRSNLGRCTGHPLAHGLQGGHQQRTVFPYASILVHR